MKRFHSEWPLEDGVVFKVFAEYGAIGVLVDHGYGRPVYGFILDPRRFDSVSMERSDTIVMQCGKEEFVISPVITTRCGVTVTRGETSSHQQLTIPAETIDLNAVVGALVLAKNEALRQCQEFEDRQADAMLKVREE